MTAQSDPFLTVRVEGPAVQACRMRMDDFLHLGNEMTRAVNRVGLVLAGHGDSRVAGRRPQDLRESLGLDIVGFTHGSKAAKALFERTNRQPMMADSDPGQQAFNRFVEGLKADLDGDAFPSGYDTGVLMAIRDLGGLFDRGINNIEFCLNHRQKPLRACYDSAKRRRVQERIRRPEQNIRTIEGRLMMADFKETGRRIRIEPSAGPSIPCTFDETLEETVHENILHFVQATGVAETDAVSGRIKSVRLTDVVQLPEQGPTVSTAGISAAGSFWESRTIDQLAEAQEVEEPTSLEEIEGGWPEDELEDGFERAMAQWRHEELEHGA